MTGIRLLIHAPTAEALTRARSNARNLLAAEPGAEVEIVVNAGGVAAALGAPDPDTDAHLRFCGNTLARQSLSAPDGARVVDAAVAHIARRQADGWHYMRA